jgi:CRP-like cAMP-binding protein
MTTTAQPSALGLRTIKLLQGLSPERLASLAAQCTWRQFDAGKPIVARNSSDRAVHFIVSGHVRVTTFSPSGRQVTFRDEPAGEIFGDLAAIDGKERSADVLALDSVLVAALSAEDFRHLIDTEPLVRDRVLQRLVGLVRLLSARVIDLSTLGVQNRIHAELLRLARLADPTGNRVRLDPMPRHGDIASQVSTYREQVTREISSLVRSGLAQREDGALVLVDVERLARMVEEVRMEG